MFPKNLYLATIYPLHNTKGWFTTTPFMILNLFCMLKKTFISLQFIL